MQPLPNPTEHAISLLETCQGDMQGAMELCAANWITTSDAYWLRVFEAFYSLKGADRA